MIDYRRRQDLLRRELAGRELDGFLVTNESNVRYLSGFMGRDSMLLFAGGARYFLTDARYGEEAAETVRDFRVAVVEKSTYATLEDLLMKKGVRRMGFEATDLPYETAHKMKGLGLKTRLVPVKRLVETIRAVKDAEEIMLLRASAGLAKKILKRVVAHVRPGVSEKSLSDRIEREFLLNGAKAGYDPIVAVDRNSSRPHARPEHYRRVRKGSFVMIDLGCKLNGYASDMTRMATTGKVKDKFKRIYNIVRRAQEKAIAAIRPGRPVSEVDLAARRYIEGEGFGKYFLHSTGHGIGLDVHESPSVSAYNTDPLEAGMVFTVEPAIYIAGFGGARIEDMALVTEDGCDVLTG